MNTARTVIGRRTACALLCWSAGIAVAADAVTLKVSSFLPPAYFVLSKTVTEWGKQLEQKSEGRLKLEIFAASQMGPAPRQFDLARTGVADIAVFAHGLTPGRFPLTEIMQLPFLTPGAVVSSEVMMDLLPEHLAKEHPGTRVLWMWTSQPTHVFTREKAVRRLDDLRGLRIRHPSVVTGEILAALGATPVNVQPADIAEALNKGTIDGTNFSYDGVATFRLGSSVKYVFEGGMSAQTFAMVMSEAAYQRLPADLRKLVDDTTGKASSRTVGLDFERAEIESKKYAAASNIQVLALSAEERERARQLTAPVTERYLAGLEAKGQPARQVYQRAQELVVKYSRN